MWHGRCKCSSSAYRFFTRAPADERPSTRVRCRIPDLITDTSLPVGTAQLWNGSPLVQRHSQQLRMDDQFLLQRAAGVLEARLDASNAAVACHKGVAQLSGLPDSICKPLYCLWSSKSRVNIDMWLQALTEMTQGSSTSRCPDPTGGQVPAQDAPVEVGHVDYGESAVVKHHPAANQPLHFDRWHLY